MSGIHTALTYRGSVIIIDRTDVANTNVKFPKGSPQAGKVSIRSAHMLMLRCSVSATMSCCACSPPYCHRLFTELPLPPLHGDHADAQTVYAEEFDLASWTFRPLDVKTNVFCSTGASIEDGTILSIGGASDASNIADPMLNGSFSIRSFTPGNIAQGTPNTIAANYEFWPRAQNEGAMRLAAGWRLALLLQVTEFDF